VESVGNKQSMSRVVNDRIYEVLFRLGAEDGEFLCECEASLCAEEVPMKLSEYVRMRDREEFVYAPGHDGHDGATP
jgi:hypothetical protein